MEKNKYEGLGEAAKPLIKWLNENANPHSIIVVDRNSGTLYSGEALVVTDEFIQD